MESKSKNQINSISNNDNLNYLNNINNNNIQFFKSNSTEEKSEIIIIKKISDLLSDICDENTNEFNNEKNPYIKPFLSKNIPQITIKDYLERLYKHSKINASTIILILIYIDRICNIHKFKLSYFNIHKLILASMIIATKYNEDEYYSSKFYAKLGGVSKAEVVALEYYFISLINFNLFVENELYNKYNDYISSAESDEDEYDNENNNLNNEEYNNENTDENNNNKINSNN